MTWVHAVKVHVSGSKVEGNIGLSLSYVLQNRIDYASYVKHSLIVTCINTLSALDEATDHAIDINDVLVSV
jgi:hypothetical protein